MAVNEIQANRQTPRRRPRAPIHADHAPIRAALAALAAAATLTSATPARAQSEPAFDSTIDLQLFEPAIGLDPFLTVPGADTVPAGRFITSFLFTLATDPLTVLPVSAMTGEVLGPRTRVVETLVGGTLGGAYGLNDRLHLAVALPLVFSLQGQGIDPATAMPSADGLQATGLGDLRAEVMAQLYARDALRVAATGGVLVPTSTGTGDGAFLGDDLPAARAAASVEWGDDGPLRFASSVGVIVRAPRELYETTYGSQLLYGAAGSFALNDRLSALAEVFGRTGIPQFDLPASPLEAIGALRVQATPVVRVQVGGGGGLVRAIGAPTLRLFLSVGWAPDYRDSDGDGISDGADGCPLLPEDEDGWEDSDGCPDNDNDGDLREDAVDKCPNEKEDLDGFQDDDGCPEDDNDGDGLSDIDDRCPLEAEDGQGALRDDGCPLSVTDADADGVMDDIDKCPDTAEDRDQFDDWDGCPEPDNDGDGIPDDADACPLCREDMDGFEDGDGCPDLDNDGDGVADSADRCPAEPETINGVRDGDGCPDRGRAAAQVQGDQIVLARTLEFRGDALRSRSRTALDQVALIMRSERDVARWRVVAAAPNRGSDEERRAAGQRRAEAIVAYLVERGVRAGTLEALGALADRETVGIAVLERAEPSPADLLCPAELRAVPSEPQAAPQPSAGLGASDARSAGDAADDTSRAVARQPARERVVSAAGVAPAVPAAPAERTVSASGGAVSAQVPAAFAAYQGVSRALEFRRDRAQMRSAGKRALAAIAALMREHPRVRLTITAHTDNRRGPERSRQITQGQADAAVDFLAGKGVPRDRLTGVGQGMDQPRASNDTSAGRSQNRRVELTFTATP